MVRTLLIVVALLLAALLAFSAVQPDEFRVERSTSIDAPAAKIYPLITDFHRWGEWSPYEKLDPAMSRTFGGAAEGQGAVYEWDGDASGSGRMEITDATPPSKVVIKLDFTKPFEAHNTAEFTLHEQGGSTDVTWAMSGANTFVAKVMQVFMSMDGLVGKDFENGLADLKRAAEKV